MQIDWLHPNTIITLGLGLILAVVVYWLWRLGKRMKAQREIDRRENQNLQDATREHDSVRARLNRRGDRPLILEVINDITTDPKAGGARPYVDFDSAAKVLEAMKGAQDDQAVDIVLHTLGGFSMAAELIANALRNHKGRTRAYVPYLAMSGGTMIALSCDEIHLGKNACLGPIDTQYWGAAFASFSRLLQDKPRDKIGDNTLLMAYEAERRNANEFAVACELLNDAHQKKDGARPCSVVHELLNANRPHDERIGFKMAERIGINVKDGCPSDFYKLVNAKLQMIRRDSERDHLGTLATTITEALARTRPWPVDIRTQSP